MQARGIDAATRLHTQTTSKIYGSGVRSGIVGINQKKYDRTADGTAKGVVVFDALAIPTELAIEFDISWEADEL